MDKEEVTASQPTSLLSCSLLVRASTELCGPHRLVSMIVHCNFHDVGWDSTTRHVYPSPPISANSRIIPFTTPRFVLLFSTNPLFNSTFPRQLGDATPVLLPLPTPTNLLSPLLHSNKRSLAWSIHPASLSSHAAWPALYLTAVSGPMMTLMHPLILHPHPTILSSGITFSTPAALCWKAALYHIDYVPVSCDNTSVLLKLTKALWLNQSAVNETDLAQSIAEIYYFALGITSLTTKIKDN